MAVALARSLEAGGGDAREAEGRVADVLGVRLAEGGAALGYLLDALIALPRA